MKHTMTAVGAIIGLAAAVAGGYFWGHHENSPASRSVPAPISAVRAVLYWSDPLPPTRHCARPGPSPFMPSMRLVPKYSGAGANEAGVRVSARIEQNLGVRTALVRRGVLRRELRVPGEFAWDRRRSVDVSARADGVITRLFVRARFDRVRAGQPLAEILAPAWSSAAAEYRVLADARSGDARALRAAARQRLFALGMSADEIRSIDSVPDGGIVLRAPVSGVISALDVREGERVGAGATLMRIDDLARLWLDAAIPQSEVAGIGPGTPVMIEVSALPGQVFAGRTESLLPEVDARTRTETARIVVENRDGRLAPGMFASVRFATASATPHPLVPDEALISTGINNRVILDLGGGRFEPRTIRTGASAGGYTEVLAGLHGGERVVTSGEFLIDSEADVGDALQRLTAPPKQAPP